jgi:hypothetical protein
LVSSGRLTLLIRSPSGPRSIVPLSGEALQPEIAAGRTNDGDHAVYFVDRFLADLVFDANQADADLVMLLGPRDAAIGQQMEIAGAELRAEPVRDLDRFDL